MPKDDDKSAQPVDELALLFAPPVAVPVGAMILQVRELSIEEIAPVAAALKPLFAAAILEGSMLGGVLAEIKTLAAPIALATGKSPEWVVKLPPAPFRKLARAFMEQNEDFFGLCLDVAGIVGKAIGALPADADGSMQSSSSGATGKAPEK